MFILLSKSARWLSNAQLALLKSGAKKFHYREHGAHEGNVALHPIFLVCLSTASVISVVNDLGRKLASASNRSQYAASLCCRESRMVRLRFVPAVGDYDPAKHGRLKQRERRSLLREEAPRLCR